MAKKPKLLTMAQADKVGRKHLEWIAMTMPQRREYVRKVNEALKSEAKAQAYFDSFKPRAKRK